VPAFKSWFRSSQLQFQPKNMNRYSLLLPILAVLTVHAPAAVAACPEASSAPKCESDDAAHDTTAPMVVRNSDGTITVRKEASSPVRSGAKDGLTIAPQVVVPLTPPKK
jgi:hypothetical protein